MSAQGNAVLISVGTDQHGLALYHVLGLEPVLGRTAAVEALDLLGDYALQSEVDGSFKELGAVTIDMVAELDRRTWIGLDETRPSFQEWCSPQLKLNLVAVSTGIRE